MGGLLLLPTSYCTILSCDLFARRRHGKIFDRVSPRGNNGHVLEQRVFYIIVNETNSNGDTRHRCLIEKPIAVLFVDYSNNIPTCIIGTHSIALRGKTAVGLLLETCANDGQL